MQQQWSDIVLDCDAGRGASHPGRDRPASWPRSRLILLGLGRAAALVRRVTVRVLAAANLDVRCARWGLTGRPRPRWPPARRRPSWLGPARVLGHPPRRAADGGARPSRCPGRSGAGRRCSLAFLPHVIVAVLVVVGGWMLAQFLAQAVLIGRGQRAGAGRVAAGDGESAGSSSPSPPPSP